MAVLYLAIISLINKWILLRDQLEDSVDLLSASSWVWSACERVCWSWIQDTYSWQNTLGFTHITAISMCCQSDTGEAVSIAAAVTLSVCSAASGFCHSPVHVHAHSCTCGRTPALLRVPYAKTSMGEGKKLQLPSHQSTELHSISDNLWLLWVSMALVQCIATYNPILQSNPTIQSYNPIYMKLYSAFVNLLSLCLYRFFARLGSLAIAS